MMVIFKKSARTEIIGESNVYVMHVHFRFVVVLSKVYMLSYYKDIKKSDKGYIVLF